MTIPLIDSHVHLDSPDYAEDLPDVLQRAREAGVVGFVSIGAGSGPHSSQKAVKLAEEHSDIWATVGVHPQEVTEPLAEDILETLAAHERVCGIGETGLDFFREVSPKADQYYWFEYQIALARRVKKPLVIHSREAGQECLRVLREHHAEEVGGVFHCFGENAAFAATLVELNFFVSIPGIVTFNKATNVQDAVREIPLERLLIETDGPFLSPHPLRGKRCESSFIIHTARKIAELKGCSVEEVAEHTSANARTLFNLA